MAPVGSSDTPASGFRGLGSVLVVDDSPAVLQSILESLQAAGVPLDQVEALETGDEALRVFSELSPDLVLLDTTTPGVDPYDAVQAMLFEAPDTKVVPVTEKSPEDAQVRELLSFGAFDVVRKPVRAADIEHLVHRVREEHSGAGRIR